MFYIKRVSTEATNNVTCNIKPGDSFVGWPGCPVLRTRWSVHHTQFHCHCQSVRLCDEPVLLQTLHYDSKAASVAAKLFILHSFHCSNHWVKLWHFTLKHNSAISGGFFFVKTNLHMAIINIKDKYSCN